MNEKNWEILFFAVSEGKQIFSVQLGQLVKYCSHQHTSHLRRHYYYFHLYSTKVRQDYDLVAIGRYCLFQARVTEDLKDEAEVEEEQGCQEFFSSTSGIDNPLFVFMWIFSFKYYVSSLMWPNQAKKGRSDIYVAQNRQNSSGPKCQNSLI